MSCQFVKITKAFSMDAPMVLYADFAPPPPGTNSTYATDNNFIYHGIGEDLVPFNPPPQPPILQEFIPAPIMMPADERYRNFPQIITFQVEVVRPRVRASAEEDDHV